MASACRSTIVMNLVVAFLLMPAVGMAADFELFWDPNCNSDPTLEGYYIHYIEEKSVIINPNDAMEIYVPLSENGFDSDAPRYMVSGLDDDVMYCFAVSGWYGDDESGMSNEICGVNGKYVSSPITDSSDGATITSSGGCFISALK